VAVAGKLVCPSDTNVAEQEMTVYQRSSGSTNIVGTAITEADGSYQFHSAPLYTRSVFIVRYSGARHGARVIVPVVADVSLQGPAANGAALPMSSNAAPGRVRETFSGVIRPEEPDRLVALKVRYAGGEWRTVAYTRTDAAGHYAFSHSFRFAGEVSVIAGARPKGELLTKSPLLTYTIAQAQNPALTIQSSPPAPAADDAVAAGQQTTITGVAAGSAHRTVRLLSRTPTGQFTTLATAQSDAAGAYAFTVDPTDTTIYEVVCGKLRSTLVRLEVG
jgi:hypothetical protein